MNNKDIITLGHGSGAILTHRLIKEIFHLEFNLSSFDDSVQIGKPGEHYKVYPLTSSCNKTSMEDNSGYMVTSTDSFVVKPLFFPGGDVGRLAVTGTVNDVSMSGAKPVCLTAAFIIEEGFSLKDLRKIAHSMQATADEVDVKIIAGDTKVVEKGNCDGLFITTTGIGFVPDNIHLTSKKIQHGDKIIINGSLGDHSLAIANAREKLGLSPPPLSDCAPLYEPVKFLIKNTNLKFVRDATRGGIATLLNEVYQETGLGIVIDEERIPIKKSTVSICNLLGLDVFYLANEGKMAAFVAAEDEKIISRLRKQKYAGDAAVIGEVTDSLKGVYLKTSIGGLRPLRMLNADPLPRIC